MTSELAFLPEDLFELLHAPALVFLRVGAMMALLPAFGEQSVPLRVRLVLTLALTALVTPLVTGEITATLAQARLSRMVLVEVLAGLALGLGLRLMVLALQIAGTIAANMTSLSQMLGAPAAEPQPAIAHLLMFAGLTVAVMGGLHLHVVIAVAQSYDILPAGSQGFTGDLADLIVRRVSRAFSLAFSLAAPFTIAATIYNLALGAINRAMPQLMVAFVGAPAITGGALFLLVLTVPLILTVWFQAFSDILAAPLGAH